MLISSLTTAINDILTMEDHNKWNAGYGTVLGFNESAVIFNVIHQLQHQSKKIQS